MFQMDATIEDLQRVMNEIAGKNTKAKKALEWTVKDMKKAAPPLIKKEVQKVYNADAKAFKTADVKVSGNSLYEFQVDYSGRLLTPQHFGQQPKKAKGKKGHWQYYKKRPRKWVAGSKPYETSMEVIKGKRVTLGAYHNTQVRPGGPHSAASPNIIMGSIVAKRKGAGHGAPVEAFRTMSVPGMVTSGRVSPQIISQLNIKAGDILGRKLEQALSN